MTSVVVPVEPTPDMIEAGVNVEGWGFTRELDREAAANTYRAMLAARPKPPALVRAVIQATDDGDHHPPISQWAAERAVEVVMGEMAVRPTVGEGECVGTVEALEGLLHSDGKAGLSSEQKWALRSAITALRRPAPTVEEVARVIEEIVDADNDRLYFVPEAAARIHALFTGEQS